MTKSKRTSTGGLAVLSLILATLLASPSHAQTETTGEDFKGAPPTIEVDFGALAGLAWFGGEGGFAMIGTIAKKIVNRGFAPDINNQVFIEAQAGPVLMSGANPFFFSTHLRWDFIRNDVWTPYALGGISGFFGGGRSPDWPVKPRFGAGTFWNLSPAVTLRGEVSAELLVAGLSFAL